MAQASKQPAKKRQLKRTETVRQRAARTTSAQPKTKSDKFASLRRIVFAPFRFVYKIIATVLRPFGFLLAPFKTKPARAIGKVLATVLLLRFFRDSWTELKQVQWPNARETTRLTIAVLVFSIVFGALVAITDYGLGKVFRKIFID